MILLVQDKVTQYPYPEKPHYFAFKNNAKISFNFNSAGHTGFSVAVKCCTYNVIVVLWTLIECILCFSYCAALSNEALSMKLYNCCNLFYDCEQYFPIIIKNNGCFTACMRKS